VYRPPDPAVIEMVNEAMSAHEFAPASEPNFTSPSEVIHAIKRFKFCKAPGPNGIPNRLLRYLTLRAITFLTNVFIAVIRRHFFPAAWKHARMVSILKPGKDPMLLSSYRPITLLDTVCKVFEKILLFRVFREVDKRGLLRDEQFGFRSRHSTTLLLARLLHRVNRNDERRLSAIVFLDAAKAFDIGWVKGLLFKLTVPNIPSSLLKTFTAESSIVPSSQQHLHIVA
jgi:hypothetical protein